MCVSVCGQRTSRRCSPSRPDSIHWKTFKTCAWPLPPARGHTTDRGRTKTAAQVRNVNKPAPLPTLPLPTRRRLESTKICGKHKDLQKSNKKPIKNRGRFANPTEIFGNLPKI